MLIQLVGTSRCFHIILGSNPLPPIVVLLNNLKKKKRSLSPTTITKTKSVDVATISHNMKIDLDSLSDLRIYSSQGQQSWNLTQTEFFL